MTKILIIGASGFLGTKLFDLYKLNPKNEIVGTYSSHPKKWLGSARYNKLSTNFLRLISGFRPNIVIHTVALSDPDICEQRKDDAERINHLGTKNIVQACKEVGARLDYISTVYVFNGDKGNYTEKDRTDPINWYGETKLRAEQEVATLPNFGIYRFDKLYGYNGQEKPNDVFSKIEKGKPFGVNFDQVRQPLLVDDVVRALQLVQEKSLNGIFHLAGPDKISKYELSTKLAHILGKEGLIMPVPEQEQTARRPRNATILTNKIGGLGMNFTPLETALIQIEGMLISKGIENQRRSVER